MAKALKTKKTVKKITKTAKVAVKKPAKALAAKVAKKVVGKKAKPVAKKIVKKTVKKAVVKLAVKKAVLKSAKKPAVKKVVKKLAAKKVAVKKILAKKPVAKKAVAKKVIKKVVKLAVKKVVAKKAVVKKAVKKLMAKKPVAKKTPAKKVVTETVEQKRLRLAAKAAAKPAAEVKSLADIIEPPALPVSTETGAYGAKGDLFDAKEFGVDDGVTAAPIPKYVPSKGGSQKNGAPEKMRDAALQILDERKAEDVATYDLEGRSAMADYMMIASGQNSRQVVAIAHYLTDKFRELGATDVRVEGVNEGNWVIVDGGDVIVHLFRPEVRTYYKLEDIWNRRSAA